MDTNGTSDTLLGLRDLDRLRGGGVGGLAKFEDGKPSVTRVFNLGCDPASKEVTVPCAVPFPS